MISQLLSRLIVLAFGTLYPGYMSYKAVRTKNVREYVKWMMYWVVFAFFTAAETVGDTFISWLPLYYELKIVFLIWLLAPATKGSSYLYRKFVHPYLMSHEQEIDQYLERASNDSMTVIRSAGQRGLQAVATGVLQSNMVNMGQSYFQQQLQQVLQPNQAVPGMQGAAPLQTDGVVQPTVSVPSTASAQGSSGDVYEEEASEEVSITSVVPPRDTQPSSASIKADARLSDSSESELSVLTPVARPAAQSRSTSTSNASTAQRGGRSLPRAPGPAKPSTLPSRSRKAALARKAKEC